LFVLRTGIQWRDVPAEMGCSGKTCWRRLVEWHAAGVWAALHRVLLERLHGGPTAWTGVEPHSTAPLCGLKGGRGNRAQSNGPWQGRDQAPSAGDGEGTPLGLTISPANRRDSRMLAPTLDALPGQAAPPAGQAARRQGL
jgi:hypothetical protein